MGTRSVRHCWHPELQDWENGRVINKLEFVGYAAAIFTTTSFVPQAIKIVTSHDTRSISIWMYTMFTTGVAFWLIYGLTLRELPIILANAVTLLLSGTILILKLKNHGTESVQ
jgi:MtN3 and saliva related transmembrane protein